MKKHVLYDTKTCYHTPKLCDPTRKRGANLSISTLKSLKWALMKMIGTAKNSLIIEYLTATGTLKFQQYCNLASKIHRVCTFFYLSIYKSRVYISLGCILLKARNTNFATKFQLLDKNLAITHFLCQICYFCILTSDINNF